MTEGLLLLAELVLLSLLLLAVRRKAKHPKTPDLGFFSYEVLTDDAPPPSKKRK
jgi:hypothetical protein